MLGRREKGIRTQGVRGNPSRSKATTLHGGKARPGDQEVEARAGYSRDELHEQVHGKCTGRRGRPLPALLAKLAKAEASVTVLREQLNLGDDRLIPSCDPLEDDLFDRRGNKTYQRNVQCVAALLGSRTVAVVAAALKRCSMISQLLQTKEFQPLLRDQMKTVLSRIQSHWSPRQAVMLMLEVHTSRDEFDALRHLLSFTYDRQSDSYQKISVWSNPFDRNDCLLMPTLAGRCLRERDRASLFSRCGVTSSGMGSSPGC